MTIMNAMYRRYRVVMEMRPSFAFRFHVDHANSVFSFYFGPMRLVAWKC
jgi:hypothetical protein